MVLRSVSKLSSSTMTCCCFTTLAVCAGLDSPAYAEAEDAGPPGGGEDCRDAHDRQSDQHDAADKWSYASCQTLYRLPSLHTCSFSPAGVPSIIDGTLFLKGQQQCRKISLEIQDYMIAHLHIWEYCDSEMFPFYPPLDGKNSDYSVLYT